MVLLVILPFFGGCTVIGTGSSASDKENTKTVTIVTWNVQALFDGDETGIEYDTYLKASGWTFEKYRARLNSLAQAMSRIASKTPDILGMEEIENIRILEDLVEGPLANCGYQYLCFGNNPGASLGIGLLSRFPLAETRVHSITDQGQTAPRPILEARLSVQNQPFVLLLCHWKAKQADKETTATE
ncbi:MAG: endonuclease/exonuclease/phosphatase family protein, partial [Treponema sp.]|nr:endonuclease/exonuclease/phosphatase family protein [Treponema sp.]